MLGMSNLSEEWRYGMVWYGMAVVTADLALGANITGNRRSKRKCLAQQQGAGCPVVPQMFNF